MIARAIHQPLSAEQERIFRLGSILVQACPGSGKTRAIVARYVRSASASNKGVALLSFTNRAVDEVRSRCASEPQLLRSPNFTGTFDTFLHNFIVTPHVIRTRGIVPRYLPSWKDLDSGDHYVRLGGLHGPGISLASFIWVGDELILPPPKYPESVYYASVESENRKTAFFAAAKRKVDRLLWEGFFDSSAARHLAHQILTSERGATLVGRLAMRFHEVIVDEFQDCDEHEHAILGLLAAAGITVVAVADPDQSIYEFRGARPDLIAAYAEKLDRDQVVSFGTNYRSTPAICALASSLRATTPTVISPCDTPPLGPSTIQLLLGSPAEQRASFLRLAEEYDIPPADCLVLAHAREDAIRLSGSAAVDAPGIAKGNRIAIAAAVLAQSGQSLATRRASLHELESIVLSLFSWPTNLINVDRRKKLEVLSKNPAWLRAVAARIAKAAWDVGSREHFSERVRATVASELSGTAVMPLNLSTNIKIPTQDAWEQLTQTATVNVTSVPFDTIHGAKGGERQAVLLYIPPKHPRNRYVVRDWLSDRDSEARRVLYVGATRAQRLLALGLTTSALDDILTILDRDGVPYDVHG